MTAELCPLVLHGLFITAIISGMDHEFFRIGSPILSGEGPIVGALSDGR